MSPGRLLWTQHFLKNAFGSYIGQLSGFPFYGYHEDDIANGLTLMPFVRYWLSLVPGLRFPPQWRWGTGLLGDNLAYPTYHGVTSLPNTDLAFAISAVPVPEPSSLLLPGPGVLGLASVLGRRSADSFVIDPAGAMMLPRAGARACLPGQFCI